MSDCCRVYANDWVSDVQSWVTAVECMLMTESVMVQSWVRRVYANDWVGDGPIMNDCCRVYANDWVGDGPIMNEWAMNLLSRLGDRVQETADGDSWQAAAEHLRCSKSAAASRLTADVHEATSRHARTGHHQPPQTVHQSVYLLWFSSLPTVTLLIYVIIT